MIGTTQRRLNAATAWDLKLLRVQGPTIRTAPCTNQDKKAATNKVAAIAHSVAVAIVATITVPRSGVIVSALGAKPVLPP
ncbi:hypothetical protein [Bradyrhizobium sp. AZCC 2289]|uniref:hypothetical protein n=1 Tax=Bradyrhizobium sp. AZCC 2289 TaxID=3117026 RepID=UPI002FF1FF73